MAKRSLLCVVFCLLHLILEVTDGLAMPKTKQRTCILGAGYSGLAAARYLQEYGVTNFTVFEATRHVGGTWRFDPHVGVDEDGLPLFTSQYKYLRTNTPRQTMEFADFPFPEDTPSYPTGTCFYKYIKQFVKKFGLMKYIQLQSLVTKIKRDGDYWNFHYTKVDTGENETVVCDYVLIANGQYRKPKWPKVDGEKNFKGTIIHSHDYKEPEAYNGRRVLLVGAGPSGLDLATHLVNHTAKLVHSHHLAYNQPNFPKHYVKKPDLALFTHNGIMFEDGTFEEVDDVIYCTGFDLDYPFIDDSCGVTVSNKFVLPLYQHIVNIRYPSMMFLGAAKVIITRVLDAQAEYAAAKVAGKFELPPPEHMLKDWLSHVYYLQSTGNTIVNVNLVGNQMDTYFANLTQEASVHRAPPVLTELRDFNVKIRLDDLLNYRDYDINIIDDTHYERRYNPRNGDVCPIEL